MTRISTIKAADIMQTKVAKLSPSDSIETAVALFEGMRIGGAPVVDAAGQPVGVLSASDIAQSSHVRSGRIEVERSDFVLPNQDGDGDYDENGADEMLAKEGFSPGVERGETVGDWMSPEFVSVTPGESLKALCRVMLEQRIHRVFVVEKRKLCGVITSFDIVRCVAEDV
jgi:CBS domain-containing protein